MLLHSENINKYMFITEYTNDNVFTTFVPKLSPILDLIVGVSQYIITILYPMKQKKIQ